MELSTAKVFLWKWTKRILYMFIGLFVLIITIGIFAPKEPSPSQTYSQTGATLSGGILSWSSDTKATGLSNTGPTVSTGAYIIEKPKAALDETKRKELYFAYRKAQDSMDEIYRNWAPEQYITDLERGKYFGSILYKKEEDIAKQYGLTWDDIDPIVAEAIRKLWNREYLDSINSSNITATAFKKAEIQKYIDSNKGNLWVICKKEIKSNLKSPSSADFPFIDFTTWIENDSIILRSYVDSQNEFGATIRTTFKCYFDYNDGSPTIKNVETF